MIRGPQFLQVEVCGVKVRHPFYCLDGLSMIAGRINLIAAAKNYYEPAQRNDLD